MRCARCARVCAECDVCVMAVAFVAAANVAPALNTFSEPTKVNSPRCLPKHCRSDPGRSAPPESPEPAVTSVYFWIFSADIIGAQTIQFEAVPPPPLPPPPPVTHFANLNNQMRISIWGASAWVVCGVCLGLLNGATNPLCGSLTRRMQWPQTDQARLSQLQSNLSIFIETSGLSSKFIAADSAIARYLSV